MTDNNQTPKELSEQDKNKLVLLLKLQELAKTCLLILFISCAIKYAMYLNGLKTFNFWSCIIFSWILVFLHSRFYNQLQKNMIIQLVHTENILKKEIEKHGKY